MTERIPFSFSQVLAQLLQIGGTWAVDALKTLAEDNGGLPQNRTCARKVLVPHATQGNADALSLLVEVEGGLDQLPAAPWLSEVRKLSFRRLKANQLDALDALLRAPQLQRLSALDLGVSHLGDDCAKLIAAADLPGLEHVGLTKTSLSDKGLRALAKRAHAIISLDINGNKVTPAGLKAFGKTKTQRGIRRLSAANNKLRRKGSGDFLTTPGFVGLEHLDVHNNNISTDFVEALTSLEHLQSLDLAYNAFGGEILALVRNPPPSLKALRLEGGPLPTKFLSNSLRDSSPLWTTLETLSLANTTLSNAEIAALFGSDKPKALRALTLPSNVDDAVVKRLGKGSVREHLSELRASTSLLSPPALKKLVDQLPGLAILDLSGSPFGDNGAEALGQTGAPIRTLDLRSCGITATGGVALSQWSRAPHLESLDISDNPLGDEGIAALANVLAPGVLKTLRSTGVGASGLAALLEHKHFDGLKELNLADNALDDSAVEALAAADLSKLRVLALDKNPVNEGAVQALANSHRLGELTVLTIDANTAPLAESATLSPVLKLIHNG